MSADQEITFSSKEELEKIWTEKYQVWMAEARNASDDAEEYALQQKVYEKFATAYDDAVRLEKFSGPVRVAEKIESLFQGKNDIEILDFGSGTGLVAEELVKFGFKNITGMEPNTGLMEEAKKKNIMKEHIIGKDVEGLKNLPSNTFDVVSASGVFFVSKTHPGTECFEEICRVLKPSGMLIIFTKNSYLDLPYVNWDIVDDLTKRNVLKLFSKEVVPGYRQYYSHEKDKDSMAVILTYQAL